MPFNKTRHRIKKEENLAFTNGSIKKRQSHKSFCLKLTVINYSLGEAGHNRCTFAYTTLKINRVRLC